MWPFSKRRPPSAPILPNEVLEAGILSVKGRGMHMAVLYATMLGYEHETIQPTTVGDFKRLIQSPPNFTTEGVHLAVERVSADIDTMCQSDTFDIYVYGPQRDQNRHLKPLLDQFLYPVREFGARRIFSAANFSVANFIQNFSVSRRERDISAIVGQLNAKRDYLLPVLLRARANGRNKYGDIDHSEFVKEIYEFMGTYFHEQNLHFFGTHYPISICIDHIEPWLVEAENNVTMPANGIDFEHWCAEQIRKQGWNVRVSKASGDQGIDIEAIRDGVLVAIQCKRYGQAIGNGSVQEAYTGAVHYRANKAVVIGTGGYTRAARELANSTGVILIDAENIAAFSQLVASK